MAIKQNGESWHGTLPRNYYAIRGWSTCCRSLLFWPVGDLHVAYPDISRQLINLSMACDPCCTEEFKRRTETVHFDGFYPIRFASCWMLATPILSWITFSLLCSFHSTLFQRSRAHWLFRSAIVRDKYEHLRVSGGCRGSRWLRDFDAGILWQRITDRLVISITQLGGRGNSDRLDKSLLSARGEGKIAEFSCFCTVHAARSKEGNIYVGALACARARAHVREEEGVRERREPGKRRESRRRQGEIDYSAILAISLSYRGS